MRSGEDFLRGECAENGSDAVRALAETEPVVSSWQAQAELLCTSHRSYREGRLDAEGYHAQRSQFLEDQSAAAFIWLPISDDTLSRLDHMLVDASPPFSAPPMRFT